MINRAMITDLASTVTKLQEPAPAQDRPAKKPLNLYEAGDKRAIDWDQDSERSELKKMNMVSSSSYTSMAYSNRER